MPNDVPDWSGVSTSQSVRDSALSVSGSAVTHTGVTIPAGTHSLRVVAVNAASGNGFGQVSITGGVTGLEYVSSDGFFPSVIPSEGELYYTVKAADTTVNVTYNPLAATVSFWLDAIMDPTAVAIANVAGLFLASQTTGAPLYTHSEQASAPLLGVTLSGANPAPWQAATLIPIRIAAGFPTTQATAAEEVVGVAGQSIRVVHLALTWDSTTAGSSLHLVDAAHGSPGGGSIFADVSQVVLAPPALQWGGPITAGHSLYMFADAATVARGWLVVSRG